MISAVVLTKNEEKNIERCLKSLQWCDEIVIVDDNSTDSTVSYALKYTTKIFPHPLNSDYAQQRNFALMKTNGDWIFFADADEVISKELAKEIIQAIDQDKAGYSLRRLDYFLGKPLRHGETANVRLLRLAREGSGEWRREVHEYWAVKDLTGELSNPIFHYSHDSISSLITKLNYYTTLDAKHMIEYDKIKFRLIRVLLNPIGKFLQNYFLRLGFLDGYPGFVMALMMSWNSLVVRVKQYEYEVLNLSKYDLPATS